MQIPKVATKVRSCVRM